MASHKRIAVTLLLACISMSAIAELTTHTIESLGKTPFKVERKFLGVTLDSYAVRNNFKNFNFTSPRIQALAKGLAPCNLRLGGTSADFLIFEMNGDEDVKDSPETRGVKPIPTNFTLTGPVWSSLTDFTKLVGWDNMFDLNVLTYRRGDSWDYSNAQGLLNYSSAHHIPIPTFQLGNEPDMFKHFNVSISGSQLAQDFGILRDLLNHYGDFHTSKIIGPDVTSIRRNAGAREFLSEFLQAGGKQYIDQIGLHQYYFSGVNATVEDFIDVKNLDLLYDWLEKAIAINRATPPEMDIVLTETSACYAQQPLSHTYAASFMWLDKLGMTSKFGVKGVHRQTFMGGLVTPQGEPMPDYFLSLLFKRLVEGPTFNVSASETSDFNLRLYGNCARNDVYFFPKGAVVIYYLNLEPEPTTLTLSKYDGKQLLLFQLTPGDEAGLKSGFFKLNGQKLEMTDDKLPTMLPKSHHGSVAIPGQTFGYIVVPEAQEKLCLEE